MLKASSNAERVEQQKQQVQREGELPNRKSHPFQNKDKPIIKI